MKTRKTKYLKARMTEDEITLHRQRAQAHGSLTQYIRAALAEYSDVNAKQRIDLVRELDSYYLKYWHELSHIGGNLNQSVKRANELAIAGLLSPDHLSRLMHVIQDTQATLCRLNKELHHVTQKATKL